MTSVQTKPGANAYDIFKTPFTDQEIQIAFDEFNQKGTGEFGFDEIKFVLECLEENVSPEEIDEMIRMVDLDGNNLVNFQEFYRMATGQSLAPLGVALPPPQDIRQVKKLDQALEQRQKMIEQAKLAGIPLDKTKNATGN